jgi:hypothetical protein
MSTPEASWPRPLLGHTHIGYPATFTTQFQNSFRSVQLASQLRRLTRAWPRMAAAVERYLTHGESEVTVTDLFVVSTIGNCRPHLEESPSCYSRSLVTLTSSGVYNPSDRTPQLIARSPLHQSLPPQSWSPSPKPGRTSVPSTSWPCAASGLYKRPLAMNDTDRPPAGPFCFHTTLVSSAVSSPSLRSKRTLATP